MNESNGQKPKQDKQYTPGDYSLEANQRAMARTNFVATVGLSIFLEAWKAMLAQKIDEPTKEDMGEAMDNCVTLAEMWRTKVNAYQIAQAEEIHNARVQSAAKSNLIIPTWDQIKDHFPNGVMGGGPNLG